MPAYAYPIKIERERKTFTYYDTHEFNADELTVSDLQAIAGDNPFTVEREEECGVYYIIDVKKQRVESDEEYDKRIKKQEAYMAEYERRQKLKA